MAHVIAWIFEKLLRLLLPSSGRHRALDAADGRPAVRHPDAPTMRPVRVSDVPAGGASAVHVHTSTLQFRAISGPPDGNGAAMVRPYLVAHEQQRAQWQPGQQERAERRLRRQRRRALWLAVHGVDVGPRLIHGVRVVA
ncbi:hypothetical protein ACFWMG_45505 [Streptomyces sp. NPDC127074]|uniref:hypothetical protein n=1 Tax=Streptomyces sp. NPDC127074 TaxID=3347130 RepID=UPI003658248F